MVTSDDSRAVPARRPKRTQRPAASRGHGATPEAVRASVLRDLLAGLSTDAAAEAAKLDGSTVRRWLAEDPDFATSYREGLATIQRDTVRQLVGAKAVALDALVRKARAGDVSAARALLQHGEPVRVASSLAIATSGPLGSPPSTPEGREAELLAIMSEAASALRVTGPADADAAIRRAVGCEFVVTLADARELARDD